MIEELTNLKQNSSDLRIAFCHLTDLLEADLYEGVDSVIGICEKYIIDHLRDLMQTLKNEDKLEQAFNYLLKSLGKNPLLYSPFSWAQIPTKNSIEDLKRASP